MNTSIDKYSKINEATDKISALGYTVTKVGANQLYFIFKNKRIIYYPSKEWATGGSINDCRGLGALLKQIKPIDKKAIDVSDIKNEISKQIKDLGIKIEKGVSEYAEDRLQASIDTFQYILDFINGEQ